MSCLYPELGMPLSPREREVLALLDHHQIAIGQELGISAATVSKHLTSIYVKLGVASKTQAVILAWEKGWMQ